MRTLLNVSSHLALLLTFLLLIPASGYAQQGTVTGQVVAQPTGEPIEGAAVSIQDTDLQAATSGGGQFRIEGVPAGTRVVQARLDGYEAQGRAVSVPIGDAAEVRLELEPKSSPERGTSSNTKASNAKSSTTDGTGPQAGSGQSPSCSAVTVPEGWVSSGGEGRAHEFRGQTYRVRTYMAPLLDDGAETLTNENSALARIPTRAPGSSRLQEDTPISSKAELLAVMGHVMNTDAPASRGGRFLSVDHPVEWGERADKWRTVRQEAFDPDDGKIASGLLLGGKLLGSVGISMATGDLSGLSKTAVTATGFAIDLGSTTLNYFESVTATPKDKSLAPAMRALADLDGEHQSTSYRETIREVQAREYVSRYMQVSSDAAEMAGALKFAAEEWSDVSSAVQNYRAAQDPIIAGTPMGKTAITNAHDFFSSAAIGAGEKVMTELLFWEIDKLSKGVNRYLFTANFYLTVLEAYARLLEDRKQELSRPGSLGSWSAYSEALSRYQYRVALYHEVRLGLMTNLYQYSNRLDDTGFGQGEAAIPDETIRRFRGLRNEQRETYAAIREEISTQMQVLDAVEEGYPDFAGQDCLTDDSRSPEEPGGDEDAGDEGLPPSDITLQTRGQKVLARSGEDVEWRYATTRPEPSVSKRDGGVAYVTDGKGYRAEASHVYALEVTTGDLLWKKKIGGYTQAEVLRVKGGTLIVEHSSGMYALNAETGGTLWAYDEFDDEATSYTFAEGTLLFLDGMPSSAHEMMGSRSPSTLHAVNLQTGQGRWSKTVVSEPQQRPTSHARYSVEGEVVTAKNTRTGRTYRLDLTTGDALKDSGPSRCATTRAEKIADEAFGAWGPTEDSPEVTVDLNGDGAKEKFYQMSGTNRLGQMKVVAISGAAPCNQIFSTIVYDSDWTEKFTVLDRQRNGYRIIEVRGQRHAFGGERYAPMKEETSQRESKGVKAGSYRYFLTDEKYDSESQDIPSLIEKKYGNRAELADWSHLKGQFAASRSRLLTFLSEVGMTKQGSDAFIRRGEDRFYGGDRHYFMTRHGGNVPGSYLVHDEMHSNTVSLGSWPSAKKALVRVPQ